MESAATDAKRSAVGWLHCAMSPLIVDGVPAMVRPRSMTIVVVQDHADEDRGRPAGTSPSLYGVGALWAQRLVPGRPGAASVSGQQSQRGSLESPRTSRPGIIPVLRFSRLSERSRGARKFSRFSIVSILATPIGHPGGRLSRPMRIALIQQHATRDKDANLARGLAVARGRRAAGGAQLAAFPRARIRVVLSPDAGHRTERPRDDPGAEPIDGPTVTRGAAKRPASSASWWS